MKKLLIIALYVVPALMLFLPHSVSNSIIKSENVFIGGKFFFSLLIFIGIDFLIYLFYLPTLKGWDIIYKGEVVKNTDRVRITTKKHMDTEILIKPMQKSAWRELVFPFSSDLFRVKIKAPYGITDINGEVVYQDRIILHKDSLPLTIYDFDGNKLKIRKSIK